MAEANLVNVSGLSKRFGATVALDRVDLSVQAGSILALLGQNGAGKSTLIKILAGVCAADSGSVEVVGHPLGSPDAGRAMAFIHQDLGLVEWMSVAENIGLGLGYPRPRGVISWRRLNMVAEEALATVASHIRPKTQLADLSRADRSLVAIARALYASPALLVLDEPTASLPATDTERLFGVLHEMRDRGIGMIYVSHRLDEVFQVADEVAVMRDGRMVQRGPLADHTVAQVVRHIVGRDAPVASIAKREPSESMVLTARGFRVATAGPVDVSVRRGEVVGMVGLSGAGHMEIGRGIAGIRPGRGDLWLAGRRYAPSSPRDAVAAGIGFVTSNRLDEGLAPDLTIRENFLPNPWAHGTKSWKFRRARPERQQAMRMVHTYGVRPALTEAPASTLSGGNQQKVIIGRWLSMARKVLVLEEPTAGVDVGAKADIYELIDQALAAGTGALLISSDFEEVAKVCHRALVYSQSKIVIELAGPELTVSALLAHAAGAAPAVAITGSE